MAIESVFCSYFIRNDLLCRFDAQFSTAVYDVSILYQGQLLSTTELDVVKSAQQSLFWDIKVLLTFNRDVVSISFSSEYKVQPNSCSLSVDDDLLADLTNVMNENGVLKCSFAIKTYLTDITQASFRLYDREGNLMQHEFVELVPTPQIHSVSPNFLLST